jgi:CheY-like chemotaxis protein
MPPVSVLLVEDEPVTRSHLAASVRSHPGLRLAAQAATLAEAFAALEEHRPQVALVDLGLPDGSGLALIRAAAAQDPPPDIMVISVFGDEKSVLAAIEAGASGYLLKDGARAADRRQHPASRCWRGADQPGHRRSSDPALCARSRNSDRPERPSMRPTPSPIGRWTCWSWSPRA